MKHYASVFGVYLSYYNGLCKESFMTNGYDEQGMPIEKLSGPLNWEAYFLPEVLQRAAKNMDLVTKMDKVAYKSYDVYM